MPTFPQKRPFKELFNRLPAELQVEIFSHYDPPVLHSGSQQRLDHAPLAYSQVCRAWRDTVLSNPRLWTSFSIAFAQNDHFIDFRRRNRDPLLLLTINQWLQRSLCAPLNVSLMYHGPMPHRDVNPIFPKIVSLLTEERHRWSKMSFHVPSDTILSLIKDGRPLSPSSFSRGIELRSSQSWAFDAAPFSQLAATLPSNLTSIVLHTDLFIPSFSDALKLVEASQHRLQHLDLQVLDFFGVITSSTTISCPSLFSLTLDVYRRFDGVLPPTYEHLGTFFSRLSTPQLERLQLTSRYHVVPLPTRHFTIFSEGLSRVGASLNSLTLNMFPMMDLQLVQCLRGTPKLEYLEVDGGLPRMDISDTFFRSLTLEKDEENEICPRLRHIVISGMKTFSLKAVGDFVASRCNQDEGRIVHLALLEIFPKDDMSRELPFRAWALFQKWRKLGLDIRL